MVNSGYTYNSSKWYCSGDNRNVNISLVIDKIISVGE